MALLIAEILSPAFTLIGLALILMPLGINLFPFYRRVLRWLTRVLGGWLRVGLHELARALWQAVRTLVPVLWRFVYRATPGVWAMMSRLAGNAWQRVRGWHRNSWDHSPSLTLVSHALTLAIIGVVIFVWFSINE